jgi:hypothetical protein
MTKYKGADLLLLHRAYDHPPNALVLLPLTAVDNIAKSASGVQWDRPEGGEGTTPPTVAGIIIVVIVSDNGGGVGAKN